MTSFLLFEAAELSCRLQAKLHLSCQTGHVRPIRARRCARPQQSARIAVIGASRAILFSTHVLVLQAISSTDLISDEPFPRTGSPPSQCVHADRLIGILIVAGGGRFTAKAPLRLLTPCRS